MAKKIYCSQCGNCFEVEDGREFAFCTACGFKNENISAVSADAVHTEGARAVDANEPNLIISYSSSHPGVRLVVRIADTRQRNILVSGQVQGYKLTRGRHVLVLKIGKHNYERDVYVTDDGRPVKIDAGFAGRAFINIDQPAPSSNAVRSSDAVYAPVNAPVIVSNVKPREEQPFSPMALVSFLCSILMIFAPVGLVLGIIEMTKKPLGSNRGFAKAGIALGAVFTAFMVIILLGRYAAALV